MNALPLVFADPDQILLYRQQGGDTRAITARQFMVDAEALAVDLTTGPGAQQFIINLCQDRYRFLVGFAATILAGKTNLLPSTFTGETLRQIFIDTPDALCLHDHDDWPFPYPHFSLAHLSLARLSLANRCHREPSPDGLGESGQIKPEHVVAQVFTSGSTGLPMPHNKTWGKLVRNVEAALQQLGISSPVSLVGTVPPQHMFGFESLVLLCLIGRCPLWSGKPFYPADIVAALDAMPEPRMLVTTPFHLQALLDAQIALPRIDRLLLATAPLSVELAERAECVTGAPLYEIYGSTETGQIANRRPTQSTAWTLFPGITLTKAHPDENDELYIANGEHIEAPVMLSDRIHLRADGQFDLLGRVADQVNMAGKRSSLNYLTAQIKAIDGITDGVFFLPEPKKNQAGKNRAGKDQVITRLCAVVVAPGLNAADILAALRDRLDPVFLPRPLILVESLPYNATGKLPQIALQAILDQHLAALAPKDQTSWRIPADHPVFAGHFPGHPLVPGALLLDWVVERVAAYWQVSSLGLRIEQAKFAHPVLPDARVTLDLQAEADRCRFTLKVHTGETNPVAVSGMLGRQPNDAAGDTESKRA
ncbi:AMP-binding protein [Halothiobacillus sp. 15-55-196]|uniref:AMP-binding protein n=1 Tax=Halothiobacillus sp. 15-55-196 TaxID=1970382 RepID=UPI0025C0A634|nr:AMP-binding protein [Halothiobacillus sp. 15-55-196]